MMIESLYPGFYELSYLFSILPSVTVIITAILSSKAMGGTLGQGLKKIAAGAIIYTLLNTAYLYLEQNVEAVINERLLIVAFALNGIVGSVFFILGFIQVYKISKALKLFTP